MVILIACKETFYNICDVIEIFFDLENIGSDTISVKLSRIEPKIINKIGFCIMSALFCISLSYKETLHNIFIVIPIFLDLENIGQNTIFVTL